MKPEQTGITYSCFLHGDHPTEACPKCKPQGKPEQIVQKMAEHIEDTLFNDEWLGTNEVGCVELLETLRAELQPLADLIRAAQEVTETHCLMRTVNGTIENPCSGMCRMHDLRSALEKLGSI